MRLTAIFTAIFLAALWESIASPDPGFYVFPVFMMVALFDFFSFTNIIYNAVLAWSAGFFAMLIWSFVLTYPAWPSYKYVLHLFFFTLLISALTYAFEKKK